MKYIKLFEEFSGHDPLEILPDAELLKRWSNITWYSLDQKQVDTSSQQIPTSLNKIVVIIGIDDDYGNDKTGYLATVATEETSDDHNAIYAMVWKEGKEDTVVARLRVDTFLQGISQLVAWTEMDGHEITHVNVDTTKKLNVSGHIVASAMSSMDIAGGSQDLKMRKIGQNKSGTIAKMPINHN